MRKDKRLIKITRQLAQKCFNQRGRFSSDTALEGLKSLASLPTQKSIFALNLFLKSLYRLRSSFTLTIESAQELSDENLREIFSAFKEEYISSRMDCLPNSSLIGGIRVKIGDMLYDASLKDKIKQVQEVISG